MRSTALAALLLGACSPGPRPEAVATPQVDAPAAATEVPDAADTRGVASNEESNKRPSELSSFLDLTIDPQEFPLRAKVRRAGAV